MCDHRFHSSTLLPSFPYLSDPALTNRGELQALCFGRASIHITGLDGPIGDTLLLFDELVPHNIFNHQEMQSLI